MSDEPKKLRRMRLRRIALSHCSGHLGGLACSLDGDLSDEDLPVVLKLIQAEADWYARAADRVQEKIEEAVSGK